VVGIQTSILEAFPEKAKEAAGSSQSGSSYKCGLSGFTI
jgi:hypothetical protein